jgi:glycosyltransferase involved in cell wall biosynthesis
MPKVSVVLAVYNGEAYIEEAVRSVFGQTFTDFEFIVINDGSTDGTSAILDSFNDPRLKVYHNPSNIRLIASLNKGLELATGDYIARMDADDCCHPERLAQQVNFLDQNPEVVLVGSNYNAFGDQSFLSSLWNQDEELRVALMFENPFAHPSTMFRRRILVEQRLQYRKEDLHAEDWGLWIELLKYGKGANLAAALLNYRISSGSISVTNRDSFVNRYKQMFEKNLGQLYGEVPDHYFELHYQLATGFYRNSDIRDLYNYITTVEKALIDRGYVPTSVRTYLNSKKRRLSFTICNKSTWRGLKFARRSGVLDYAFMRYASLKLIRRAFGR